MVVYTCHVSYAEIINSIEVQASPGINTKPYLNITKAERARGMAQVAEHLPRKCPKFKPQSCSKKYYLHNS
jgi:hypothetical protein